MSSLCVYGAVQYVAVALGVHRVMVLDLCSSAEYCMSNGLLF